MSDENFDENESLPNENESMDHKTAMNILGDFRLENNREIDEWRKAKQLSLAAEKAREEDKHIEHMQWLKQQNEIFEKLLEDSNNAIEQRNVLIRLAVEEAIKSDKPKEEKKGMLLSLLVPVASVSSGASDLMQMLKDALEALG